MHSKPELIVISQNLMGGGASFHRNMLANKPDDFFDIKCIYLDPQHWVAKRLEDNKIEKDDVIFKFHDEPKIEIAKKLNEHISNRAGVIIANLPEELSTIDYYPKPKKTVYFICHDKGFLSLADKYDYLIDVFIAHNFEIFESLQKLLPDRLNDIHFIQHGVKIQNYKREKNENKPLQIVFLARHVKTKGIYDLPEINQQLLSKNIAVNWMILGDGEEKENFKKQVSMLSNFHFDTPKTNENIIEILKTQDIYILPSSHDGLPVSLLESMSVGCVPIVYNFSNGIKRVITSDIGYVENIGDINGVVEKIEILNNDRALLFEKGKNAINKVEQEFNIQTQANEYFNLYKNYKALKRRRVLTLKAIENKYGHLKMVNVNLRLLKFIKRKFSSL